MTTTPKFAFEAAGQAAGYYYQLRYSLLRALQQIRRDPTGSISIEKLDDISLWTATTPQEIDQLKHTTNSTKVITDYSPQLWRTLANWITLLSSPPFSTNAIRLNLVTNASIAKGSALERLGSDDSDRDVRKAIELLSAAAGDSSDTSSASDRVKFSNLGEADQRRLISAITVLPNSSSLSAIGAEIDELLYYACDEPQLVEFRQELEGWWLQVISRDLSAGTAATVPLTDVVGKVSFLREKYKRSLLTIDVDGDELDQDGLIESVFIQQMMAVNAATSRLKRAQKDFLRAGTQRSKWIRELKLDPAELTRYDAELEEQWEAKHLILLDNLGASPLEADKVTAGRNLLGWAETRQIPLRGAAAQFLTSGSYHVLADQMRVGWHPDFRELLKGVSSDSSL